MTRLPIAVLRSGRTVLGALALFLVVPPSSSLVAQTRMGSVDDYLMDREAEIAMARSAAPHGLGDDADVWVLSRSGYVQAAEGTNGFVCFVGRGWSGPILIGDRSQRRLHPDVFNPRLRAPHCFNPLAASTVLPWQLKRTEALLSGVAAEDVADVTSEALRTGELQRPPPGAMAYMTSSHQHLGDNIGSWRPHVMIYLPDLGNADWGIPGFTNEYPFVAEGGTPWSVAVVPMSVFSDGSVVQVEAVTSEPSG